MTKNRRNPPVSGDQSVNAELTDLVQQLAMPAMCCIAAAVGTAYLAALKYGGPTPPVFARGGTPPAPPADLSPPHCEDLLKFRKPNAELDQPDPGSGEG